MQFFKKNWWNAPSTALSAPLNPSELCSLTRNAYTKDYIKKARWNLCVLVVGFCFLSLSWKILEGWGEGACLWVNERNCAVSISCLGPPRWATPSGAWYTCPASGDCAWCERSHCLVRRGVFFLQVKNIDSRAIWAVHVGIDPVGRPVPVWLTVLFQGTGLSSCSFLLPLWPLPLPTSPLSCSFASPSTRAPLLPLVLMPLPSSPLPFPTPPLSFAFFPLLSFPSPISLLKCTHFGDVCPILDFGATWDDVIEGWEGVSM